MENYCANIRTRQSALSMKAFALDVSRISNIFGEDNMKDLRTRYSGLIS